MSTHEKLGKLIVLCGPTASGKTNLAIALAHALNGEVVSADSMQVYRSMDIGTAKPTEAERGGIAHHMLDVAGPEEAYSASLYQRQARAHIADIEARGKLPILCGGTGLYINAVLYPLDFADRPPDHKLRETLQAMVEKQGPGVLYRQLMEQAPELAKVIHPNNVKRVIRALEALNGGEGASVFDREPLYQLAWLGLTMDRERLNRRIDHRVDVMLVAGLVGEARGLMERNALSQTAAQAIGYKEIIAHLRGECTLEEAVERVKRSSRQYAKRQMTWFRRESVIHWLDVDAFPGEGKLLQAALGYIRVKLDI